MASLHPPLMTPSLLPPAAQALCDTIKKGQLTVAVLGMGYVGLPLAVCMAKVGCCVLGLDVNPKRIAQLNSGDSYIDDVASAELSPLVEQGLITGHTDFSVLKTADVIVICVPTPLTLNRDPDTSYIQQSAQAIAQHLRPGQLVTLESTTYPGTTQEVLLPLLQQSGLHVGQDFFVAFSPERVDPGNARYTTHNTNKVVGGVTPVCMHVAQAFYQKVIQTIVPVSSPACAEMVKVFENTFRAVNIALVNELALLCDKMDLNVWEVVEAAATKPFGMMRFDPGPGVGGHCIPIDPFYLTWKAREYNFHTRFIELAGEINALMPQFVREKLIRALGQHGKPLHNSRLLIVGMAYKANLSDWRHSPSVDLLTLLQDDCVQWQYHDPYIPSIGLFDNIYQHQDLSAKLLAEIDAVVLMTAHQTLDLERLLQEAPLVIDTRNACRHITDPTLLQKRILL